MPAPGDGQTIWRSVCEPGVVVRFYDAETDTWVEVDGASTKVQFHDYVADLWIDASCLGDASLIDDWNDGTGTGSEGPEGGGGESSGDGGVATPGQAVSAYAYLADGSSDAEQPYADPMEPGDAYVEVIWTAAASGQAKDATVSSGSPVTASAESATGSGEAWDVTYIDPSVAVSAGAATATGYALSPPFGAGASFDGPYSRDFFSSETAMVPYPVYGDTTVPFMASYSSTTTIDTAVLDLFDMTVTTDSTTVSVPAPSDTFMYLNQAGSDKILQQSYYIDDGDVNQWLLTLHDLSGTNLGTLDFGGAELPVHGSYTPPLAAATDGSGAEFMMVPDYVSGTGWVVRVWDVSGASPSMTPLATGVYTSGGQPLSLQHISTGGWLFSNGSVLMQLEEDGTVTELISGVPGYYFRSGQHGWVGQLWSVDWTETTFTIFDETATEVGTLVLSGIDPDAGYAISTGPIYHGGRWWIQVLYEYDYITYTPPDEIRLYSCTDDGTFVLEDTQETGIWGEAGVVPLDSMQFLSYWRRDPTPSTDWWEGAYDFLLVLP